MKKRSTGDPTGAPNPTLEHAPPLTGCSEPEKEKPQSSQLSLAKHLAHLGAECIKLDAKVDQLIETVNSQMQDLRQQYRQMYDTVMALQSKVYRLENQR